MSKIHLVVCDKCGETVHAKYNGEHYLPPFGWVELTNSCTLQSTGNHFCNVCAKKLYKKTEVNFKKATK